MKILGIAATIALALAGCRAPAPEPVIRVQRVDVPVPVPCPAPPMLRRPVSAVLALPPDATPAQQAKALALDLAAWVSYALQEEQALKGYQPAPEDP